MRYFVASILQILHFANTNFQNPQFEAKRICTTVVIAGGACKPSGHRFLVLALDFIDAQPIRAGLPSKVEVKSALSEVAGLDGSDLDR